MFYKFRRSRQAKSYGNIGFIRLLDRQNKLIPLTLSRNKSFISFDCAEIKTVSGSFAILYMQAMIQTKTGYLDAIVTVHCSNQSIIGICFHTTPIAFFRERTEEIGIPSRSIWKFRIAVENLNSEFITAPASYNNLSRREGYNISSGTPGYVGMSSGRTCGIFSKVFPIKSVIIYHGNFAVRCIILFHLVIIRDFALKSGL